MWVDYRVQTQAFGENGLAYATKYWHLKHNTLVSHHCTLKPHYIVLLCELVNRHRLLQAPSTSPVKLSFSGACSLPGHVSEAAEHSFFCLGRKDCTLHQDFWKTTHNHDLFFYFSHKNWMLTLRHPLSHQDFTCLDRIVHLTEVSTSNEQSVCLLRNWVESCTPSHVFIHQYAWWSKSVSLLSSKEQYLYKVRRGALVNLFWDSLIIRGRRKVGRVP